MYLTVEEFLDIWPTNEIVQLSNLDDPLGDSIDAPLIGQAIDDASETVNGYLANRYALPLPQTPKLIKRQVADIARYFLHRYDPPEDVRRRYDDAIKLLEKIRRGDIAIGVDQAGTEIAPNLGVTFVSGAKGFDLEGY